MVLKAFLVFSQQPKLEGGKWERKHFKLIFLQVMHPVRWDGKGSQTQARDRRDLQNHIFMVLEV